jgi:transposase
LRLLHSLQLLCHRRGENARKPGVAQDENSPVSELRGFASGLRRDWAAATAGLTRPYSSGAVEGHVNRIILWNLICQVTAMT